MSDAHVRAFVRESEEGITDLNNALLALESDPDDGAAMDSVFRTAHTLKGNAAAMGFGEFSGLAHAMEDLLDEVRDGDIAVSGDLMDLLFEAVDSLDEMLGQIDDTGEATVETGELADALRSLAESGSVSAEEVAGVTADADDGGAAGADDADDTDADDTDTDSDDADDADDAAATDAPAADGFDHGLTPGESEGVYRATVTLAETEMPGVDAIFVLDAADDAFAGVATDPDREAVEDGAFDGSFDCYVVAESGEAVAAGLDAVRQTDSVEVRAVDPAPGDAAGADGDDAVEANDATDAGDEGGANAGDDAGDETETGDDDAASASDSGSNSGSSSDTISSIRVDVERLDDLYGLVEQLVTSRIKLRREMEEADVDSGNLDELDKISSNLQNTVMDMRLIPLSAVVDTFPRLVRDLSREQGKSVSFDIDGRDIELDRTILTEIRDPLVHILRNAVDHGIESAEEREAAGKPPEGSIELRATRERDHVTIVVEDDGGGIDADAIREKAVEKGAKTPAEVEAMTDAEARELVFHPGFSTNDEVTDVSGRGVGMDVVRTTVKELDGTVTLDSTPGEGTRFEIRLPVTVAIVRVMFVRVDGVEYGVPIKNIAEVSRADAVDTVHGDEVVRHDDDIYPVVRLSSVLHDRGGVSTPALSDGGETADGDGTAASGETADGDGTAASGETAGGDETAGRGTGGPGMLLRIHETKRSVALHCDEVLHQEEVVVKPLEGVLSGTPGLSGTAVLGDGDVVSILDVETLGGRR
ncbi:chemotaxis protein CheA [Candidatus Halobonum tyrrellensis]|uniref:Chemotaxis protein CheA n=1 Tax=Candidatus Halobonum tyrrellensis G22 TaxID=1324957 RepID=V4J2C9_9EURY|nr:chemotaxis protein CheA [Candidatus Halobonum tyrrellensis]ESP89567.1 chemotaxis protein CheA [Candidatus Halobonum tyrrellensis G22]